MSVSFRWLGIAGIEITASSDVLLIDPYLTRISLWKTFFGRIQPDLTAVQVIKKCNYIMVTHSHFDHLLDVPSIFQKTGAKVFGSPNTQCLLASLGVAPSLIQTVKPGDSLSLGEFNIRVFPFEHARVPGYNSGALPHILKPPLRARDYRMDFGCCYHISAGGVTFLTDPGFNPSVNVQADVLFTQPYHDISYYEKLPGLIRPKAVIPIHWDNIFRRNDPMPYFVPPALKWPPLQRIDLQVFAETIHKIAPDIEALIPQAFKSYEVSDLIKDTCT